MNWKEIARGGQKMKNNTTIDNRVMKDDEN